MRICIQNQQSLKKPVSVLSRFYFESWVALALSLYISGSCSFNIIRTDPTNFILTYNLLYGT